MPFRNYLSLSGIKPVVPALVQKLNASLPHDITRKRGLVPGKTNAPNAAGKGSAVLEKVAKRAKGGVLTIDDNRFVGVGSINVLFDTDPYAVLPRRLPDLETHADTAFELIHSVGITPRAR
ncbi:MULTISPECIES: hypothetical protein [Mesorhizobium]|uniref:Uncharacterized protein n=1 Tax=Rhizobium loti TaxID=381 RepID=A0A1A5PUB9_RHILI|nr:MULTISPECIES: hypothetical protein [Mesorhizobium]ANN61022.1 hypothetical protein A9174_32965 [Mesorhizobium loti NZP2037]OBP78563.1 hypothetical protein BAE41_30485 [Mesorhizobium loti]OBP82025.1 hypothetical protein BAE39_00005 [Mesorhizobium loti]OBP97332.1 hypothetical protein BAE38_00015 [Mesorhizobium loti]OBQ59025.1 hypothetical protein A8145_25530 [Mesorhizobium loti]